MYTPLTSRRTSMLRLMKPLLLCTFLLPVRSHLSTIGILHDGSWKSIRTLYEQSIATFQLILRDVQRNHLITSGDVSFSRKLALSAFDLVHDPSPIVKWNYVVIISSCAVTQRILQRYDEVLRTKPVLILTLDRCSIPKQMTTVYLKLAQDCVTCFQDVFIAWLNSQHVHVESYNGDQLSLFKERNLAAKEYLRQNSPKLSTIQLPPMVELSKAHNGDLKAKGLFMDIVNAIVDPTGAKFTLTFPGNPPAPPMIGGLENGTWTGLNRMVYRREVDCGVYAYATTAERNRDFDIFTSGNSIVTMAILIPAPEFVHNLDGLVKPFHFKVWIVLLITAFITVMVLASFSKKNGSYLEACGYQLVIVVQVICSQGSDTPDKSMAGRLVSGGWCLVALVCGYVYTSTLTSYIAVPSAQPKLESLADLAYKRPVKPLVFGWGIYNNQFGKAREGPSAILRDYFAKHPDSVLTDFREGIEKVRSGDYAFISSLSMLQNLVDQDYRRNGRCSFTIARQAISLDLVTWIFSKNSAASVVFNTGYTRARDFGLEDFLTQAYGMVAKYCQKENDFLKPDPKFTLAKIKSCFLVLAFGFLVALISFLAEICTHYSL